MKFLVVLACLFALAIANQGKRELELNSNIEVSPDQDVDDWYYRTYYGHYYNPYGYYGQGYRRRGRRSVEETNQRAEESVNVNTDTTDQDASQWYGLSYNGRYNPYHGHGHLPGRLATKYQSTKEPYYPSWGYNRDSHGGYPFRPAYYYGPYPASFSYAYSH